MASAQSTRSVKQVGEPFAERIVSVKGRGKALQLDLFAGERLVDGPDFPAEWWMSAA